MDALEVDEAVKVDATLFFLVTLLILLSVFLRLVEDAVVKTRTIAYNKNSNSIFLIYFIFIVKLNNEVIIELYNCNFFSCFLTYTQHH